MAFACTKCQGMPLLCMNNDEGDIVCVKCSKDMDHMSPNKALQKIIKSLKTRCLSLTEGNQPPDDNDIERGNVLATRIRDNECDWNGTIVEWENHGRECPFVVIECDECKTFKTQRQSDIVLDLACHFGKIRVSKIV
eukprot:943509_1